MELKSLIFIINYMFSLDYIEKIAKLWKKNVSDKLGEKIIFIGVDTFNDLCSLQ